MKIVIKIFVFICLGSFTFAQSPFDAVKGKREDVGKRDLFSKHYINGNGSYTALIGAGPIHYEKDGQFLDINHTVTANNDAFFPYTNKTNLFESYFGATAHKGVKNKTAEGEITEFLNTEMYWEVGGQKVNSLTSADATASVQGEKVYYPNLYGTISAEFIVLTGKRKLNYLIPNKQALGNVPENAAYLVFTEDIVLPNGWTHTVSEQGVYIKTQTGENIYLYENPVSIDAAEELRIGEDNTVFETALNGNTLTVKTKVKTTWLLDNNRQFPVKVDPITSVTPDNTTNWTRSVASDGWDYTSLYFGTDFGYFVRGFVKYNTSSIASGSTVNSVVGHINITGMQGSFHATNAFRFKSAIDPTLNAGSNLYNSGHTTYSSDALTNTSTGWKQSAFNTTGRTVVQNNLGGSVSFAIDPAGSWHNTSIYTVANHTTGADRPYLEIDYTSSTPCSGTPAGGTTSLSATFGTFGSSFTGSVTGSTTDAGITYQWESAPSSSGPWTNVSGATNITHIFTAPNSANTTWYRRKTTCTNSGQESWSSAISFYTYACSASHSDGNCAAPGDCGYIGISNVNLGTINNTTNYHNTAPAYNYYSGQSTNVQEGNNYELKVTYRDPYNNGEIGAWIDWNGDGDFSDPNEFLGIFTNVTHNTQLTFNFNVPGGTAQGTKIMRIRSVYNGEGLTSSDACTTMQYGETEDYNVNVLAPPAMTCATLSNLAATIGNPANGINHVLDLNWDALLGATSYDVEFSMDNGINYYPVGTGNVTTNSAVFNAGDLPNAPFLFRVRAKNSLQTCAWTNIGPVHTAADDPGLPVLSNAIGTTLQLTIPAETPQVNPAYTEYSIVCQTTGEYVQANGTLGNTPVWQTKTQWGTVTVTGLSLNNTYCFYLQARNEDGHVVGGGNALLTQTFDSDVLTAVANNNVYFAPNSNPPIVWNASNGCPSGGGSIGYNANWNNYWGNFVRLPEQNMTGMNQFTLKFDLTNSFTAGRTDSDITFSIWADNGYRNIVSEVKVNGTPIALTQNGRIKFDAARTCVPVEVTFDLNHVNYDVGNHGSIFVYINASSSYQNSDPFFFYIDNISISQPSPTACITTSSAPTPVFHNYGGADSLAFNNSRINTTEPVFRLSHGAVTATNYEIEVNTSPTFSGGTSWTQVFSGSYPAHTQQNFKFTNASAGLTDGTTYYVRARINSGTGYGLWTSKLHSFTYRASGTAEEWFQTTTPQFETGILAGTVSSSNEVNQDLSGGGGNVIVNGSFENGSGTTADNWSVNGQSWMFAERSTDHASQGTLGMALYLDLSPYNSYMAGNDRKWFHQTVNMTGITSLTFDLWQEYIFVYSGFSNGTPVEFQVIIGDENTGADISGTVVYSKQSTNNAVSTYLNESIDLSSYGFTGNKVIKFVYRAIDTDPYNYSYYIFYVDNIQATSTPSGTITSSAIHKSSALSAPGYDKLFWSQQLNGGTASIDLQYYNTGTSSWTDISGFTNISDPTDGLKTHDISAISYDSIRLVATLSGGSAVQLSDWGVSFASAAPLPVELEDFWVSCENDVPTVFWQTASESNSASFTVEYSENGTHWEVLQTVEAAGNSSSSIEYKVRGKENGSSLAYYRLIQRDFDGKEEVFGPVSANCFTVNQSISVYPNPNRGAFNLSVVNNLEEEAAIRVFDAQGSVVYQKNVLLKKGNQLIQVESVLTKGVYFLKLANSRNNFETVKVVVN